MRGTHEGLPEIVDAYKRDDHCFGAVRVTIGNESKTLEFGLVPQSYRALKRILSMRPFDKLPGLQYRYFFVPSMGKTEGKSFTHIRIEQGERGKQFKVEAPQELISNLMWFFQMKDFEEASHLSVLDGVH